MIGLGFDIATNYQWVLVICVTCNNFLANQKNTQKKFESNALRSLYKNKPLKVIACGNAKIMKYAINTYILVY